MGKVVGYLFLSLAAIALLAYSVANNTCEQEGLATEQRIFTEVNQYRVENGLRPLERNAFMDELAREQCQYLCDHVPAAGYIHNNAHDGFDERRQKIIDTLGSLDISENVAYGGDPVGSCRGSYLHNLNMLRPQWVKVGIGYHAGYTCMIFSN